MNQVANYDPETGEVISTAVASIDRENIPLAVQLAQVELDQAVSTARAYPMHSTDAQLVVIRDRVASLVMLDEETAHECVYALPRGGKPIKGPSVRLAEIVAQQYGNCKVGARIREVNKIEKYIEAEGVFMDLETGFQRSATFRRKISDKNGRLFNDDMITVTGNAAMSIAIREAILKGIPKAVWRKAYVTAENVIAGEVRTLAVRRDGAIKAFAVWGITPDQIFAALEIDGIDDIGLDQIVTLTTMFKAIKSGEQQVEEYFPAKADKAAGVAAAKGTAGKLSQIASATGPAEKQKAAAKPKADEKPAEQGQDGEDAAGEGRAADEGDKGQGDAENGQQDDDAGQVKGETDEARQSAYERGRNAHGRGMKPDAIPSDLKGDELRGMWVKGWNDARDEADGKGGEA